MMLKPRPGSAGAPVKINYKFPNWCSKAPPGTHIDVMKDDKLMEKLLIDQKKFYLFGRNADMCDFVAGHASISRAHCALTYHKILKKSFIIDLKSAHGTFLGPLRMEAEVPKQLPYGVKIRLGASTRYYVLQEAQESSENLDSSVLLPEEEEELDNLTELNTARNKKITELKVEDPQGPEKKNKRKSVTFNNEEDVINPEDVDPSIGKFRNVCQITIIPSKRKREGPAAAKMGMGLAPPRTHPLLNQNSDAQISQPIHAKKPKLYDELESAPDPSSVAKLPAGFFDSGAKASEENDASKSKKYGKEAWPGRGNDKIENFGL
ncbi:unnamed protein product [Oikopleura dioica]|uniref:FHA domain-containing protein n=1 Tax=Oikopleura dioica TaxID=34765 RepID=E4X1D1_OIKDI|nr:unnamed protein product [Oikopleura dioica]